MGLGYIFNWYLMCEMKYKVVCWEIKFSLWMMIKK